MFHQTLSLLLAVTVVGGQKNVPNGPRGVGTKFESCGGGSFFGGGERCFKVKLVKLSVQMGNQNNDGTDDDVRVKVCSDEAQKTNTSCCTTPKLKRSFRDDWSKGDLEKWTEDKLGNCTEILFTIRKGLEITLLKTGSDNLVVSSINIDTEGQTGGNRKSVEQFQCGQINLDSNSPVTKFCGTFPYSYEKIKIVNVTMGNTGTDEDVKVDICSDVDQDVCCKTKLSSSVFLIDDWSRNDNEVWKEKHFGECKDMMYKVNNTLKVSLETRNVPQSGLVVNKLVVTTENMRSESNTYDCGGYTMTKKERLQKPCHRETTTKTRASSSVGGKKGVARLVSQVGSLVEKTATRPPFRG